jgi:hypothetical protein
MPRKRRSWPDGLVDCKCRGCAACKEKGPLHQTQFNDYLPGVFPVTRDMRIRHELGLCVDCYELLKTTEEFAKRYG